MKLSELDEELDRKNLSGFWKTHVPVHSPEAPFLWKWNAVHDGLMKAKDSIGIEQAERFPMEEGDLEWEKGDYFVIPLWQWHCHENLSAEEAVLFSISDRPVVEALELYREERRSPAP